MGYVIYRIYGGRNLGQRLRYLSIIPRLLVISVGLSLLPDVDSIAGFLLGDFGRYHNNGSHSLFAGLVVALVIGGLVWLRKRSEFGYWFTLVLLCYHFHLVLDFITFGRGVMLFWPLSTARFVSPAKLFYGLHWSDGVVSIKHVWTLLNESGFAVLIILAIRFLEHRISAIESVRRLLNPFNKSIREED
jgi:membrane-bound metal-dependent hydrolase YbcI (DUF457 family)